MEPIDNSNSSTIEQNSIATTLQPSDTIQNSITPQPDTITKSTVPGKPKKPLNRIQSSMLLVSNPPPIPFLDMVTLEPQAYEIAGKLIHALNDPALFNKIKNLAHKKLDLSLHNIDIELNKQGGGESFFTQEECSFFSNNQLI